ncbi:MAG: hypothetical protein ACRC7C_14420 [Beijerinckiaceae bacterium]
MLPIEQRGEVVIDFLDRPVVLCLSVGALARLATSFGEHDTIELFARLLGPTGRGPSFADLGAIAEAMSGGAVSRADIEALMPAHMEPLLLGIAKAVTLAFPEQKKSPAPETTEQRLAREFLSTTGSASPSA